MKIYNIFRRFFSDLPALPDPSTLTPKGKHDYDWIPPTDPLTYLGPIDRRNLWHRIHPERYRGFLIRMFKRAVYEEKKRARDAEDERRAKLRAPPTNVRREGQRVRWDPPDLEGGEAPAFYWVEGQLSNGEWTRFQPPIYPDERLEKVLYPRVGAVRVAAYYHDEPQKWGWGFRFSPTLRPFKPGG